MMIILDWGGLGQLVEFIKLSN